MVQQGATTTMRMTRTAPAVAGMPSPAGISGRPRRPLLPAIGGDERVVGEDDRAADELGTIDGLELPNGVRAAVRLMGGLIRELLGGRLRIDIEDGGTRFWVSGEYLVLDRPSRLSFSWSCSTWPDPGLKSVVNVLLEPRGNEQTLMTIEHTLLPPGLVTQHERGWTAIAQQLAEELAP